MELFAENGVKLGKVVRGQDNIWLEPRSKMSEYMLQNAYQQIRELNKRLN